MGEQCAWPRGVPCGKPVYGTWRREPCLPLCEDHLRRRLLHHKANGWASDVDLGEVPWDVRAERALGVLRDPIVGEGVSE